MSLKLPTNSNNRQRDRLPGQLIGGNGQEEELESEINGMLPINRESYFHWAAS